MTREPQGICRCGHPESSHETVEYRGNKDRHCLQRLPSETRCGCKRFVAAMTPEEMAQAGLLPTGMGAAMTYTDADGRRERQRLADERRAQTADTVLFVTTMVVLVCVNAIVVVGTAVLLDYLLGLM